MERHDDQHQDPTLLGNDRPRDDAAGHGTTSSDGEADLGGTGRASSRAEVRADADRDPSAVEDHIGEAAGGISGGLTGAAIGSLGGPIGTLIGGIAGAIGGWWAGRAIADAASRFGDEDDTFYRERYETSPNRLADRRYDDVRPAYQLGYLASQNPEYAGRSFDEIEPHLQHGWTEDIRTRHGDWSTVRHYAREAYSTPRLRSVGGASAAAAAAGMTHPVDRPVPDVDATSRTVADVSFRGADVRDTSSVSDAGVTGAGVSGARVDDAARRDADDPGVRLSESSDPRAFGDGTNITGYALGADAVTSEIADRTTGTSADAASGAERAASSLGSAVDDVKDRIDGDPASRPGLDPTDARSMGLSDRGAPETHHADRATDRDLGDRARGTMDAAGDALRRGKDRVVDAADDVKDRIDGNPASRPGKDPTDRR